MMIVGSISYKKSFDCISNTFLNPLLKSQNKLSYKLS